MARCRIPGCMGCSGGSGSNSADVVALGRRSRTIPAWPAAVTSPAPVVRVTPRRCVMRTAAGIGTMRCCAASTPPRPRR
jgi:hypothetical protein